MSFFLLLSEGTVDTVSLGNRTPLLGNLAFPAHPTQMTLAGCQRWGRGDSPHISQLCALGAVISSHAVPTPLSSSVLLGPFWLFGSKRLSLEPS
jgi:hypothetical protein